MHLSILGVTPQKEKQFFRKKIFTVEDLMRFLPRKYYDFRNPKTIKDAQVGEIEAIIGTVVDVKAYNKVYKVTIEDSNKWTMEMLWFNGFQYISKFIDIGNTYIFYGKVQVPPGFFKKQMVSPKFSIDIDKYKKIMPIYSSIQGMGEDYLLDKINKGLAITSKDEYLDIDIINEFGLIKEYEMQRIFHQPLTMEEIERAKERLIFDELFRFGIVTSHEYSNTDMSCDVEIKKFDMVNAFIKTLPYKLTDGDDSQESTVFSILENMKKGIRTNSLVQGDVGCGKTMVAILLMIGLVENGYQAAMMAPTTVLAKQHYEEIVKLLSPFGIKVAFLGGKMKAKEKRTMLEAIKTGDANIVVGTHSVISKDVEFKNLGLAIVDEEHRFGVVQRRSLEKKAEEGIHMVTMSATPIPRSLAMTIYGDFVDVYTIRKMPAGRKKIITKVEEDVTKAYDFMAEQIKDGRQCYVVCPLIEETESERMEGVKSTEETYVEMCDYFSSDPSIRICHINGKMKQDEINEHLSAFARHEYDIIISTTIIEVGVNVPNSTVILVKNAERFGLATLHQLRGRVGRGSYQSYCLLQSPKGQTERLSIMESTTDGFVIAEKDLELRGMGDFIGTKQSGENKAVMLMLGNPSLYNNIKSFTMEIVKDSTRMKKYQFIIDDFNSIMGEEEDF